MPDSASVVLGPKLGEVVYADIGANFPNSLRAFLRAFDALVQASVLSVTLATPPGSPANGDAYVVAASPTGAWAGQANSIAVWSTQIATADTNTKVPAWEFHAPAAGWRVFNVADGKYYSYSGTAWAPLAAAALMTYTVAGLPASPGEGAIAFATNGRKVGEGAGSGTGVPVYFSNASWRTYSGDAAVTS